MFEYTRATLDKVVNDLKRSVTVFNFSSQIVYILYLIYAIIVPVGFLYINIALLTLASLYFIFYIIYYSKKGRFSKEVKETVKHSFSFAKILVRAITLGITLYGIYTATSHPTSFSVILTTLMIISWLLTVSIEVITIFVEYHVSLFGTALEADIEAITKPVQAVGNVIKKITGQEIAPPKEKTKTRKRLDKLVIGFRQKRDEKKLQKIQERKLKSEKLKEKKKQKNVSKTQSTENAKEDTVTK